MNTDGDSHTRAWPNKHIRPADLFLARDAKLTGVTQSSSLRQQSVRDGLGLADCGLFHDSKVGRAQAGHIYSLPERRIAVLFSTKPRRRSRGGVQRTISTSDVSLQKGGDGVVSRREEGEKDGGSMRGEGKGANAGASSIRLLNARFLRVSDGNPACNPLNELVI
jgi:hypothetical protein